MEMEEL